MARQRVPGIPAQSEVALLEILEKFEKRLSILEKAPTEPSLVTTNFVAREGQFIRVQAPPGGIVIQLPTPRQANRSARITFSFETTNPVGLQCNGGTVNGVTQVINTALGTFDAICDGEKGWSVALGVSASGSPTDAQFFVGAAHASLTNERVAADTTEIDVVLTTPGAVSWTLNPASVGFSKLVDLAGLSVLGRAANSAGVMAAITAGAADRYLRSNALGTSLEFGNPVSTSIVNSGGSFQRAAMTGAIAVGQNLNATVFSGIRDNGAAENDRTNLNFVSGTGTTASVTDDAGNDELEIRVDWNGLAARRNSGSFLTARRQLNVIEGANISLTLNSDAGDDENELTIAVTGLVSSGAVTGAIAHGAGGGACVFSGIRNDGAATTDRTNLNFRASTTTNVSVIDDAGSDEIEIAFPVNQTAAFNWTGAHSWSSASTVQFSGPVFGIGIFTFSTTGTVSNLAIGAVNTVRWSGVGNVSLTGMVPTADGQWVFIENVDDTDFLRIVHDATSAAANRFYIPRVNTGFSEYQVYPRSGVWARYDGTLQRWILAIDPVDSLSVSLSPSTAVGVRSIEFIEGNGIDITQGSSTDTIGTAVTETIAVNSAADFTWSGTHLHQEKASSPTVGAGNGMFWVDDLVPTEPMFTDDVEADWRLNVSGVAALNSIQQATGATTTLTGATFTVPGGTLRVGSTYKAEGMLVYSRGSTATAQNTVVELNFGGSVIASATITNPTANGTTGLCYFTALFTVLSIGAAGTFIGNVQVANDFALLDTSTLANLGSTVRRLLDRSVNIAAFGTAKDTTANQVLSITARMSAAVVNTQLTITNCAILKVR
jgi:hypothetical protein